MKWPAASVNLIVSLFVSGALTATKMYNFAVATEEFVRERHENRPDL
jgi:hypothetical protein